MTISQNHQSVGLGGAVFEFPKSGIHSSDHTDKQGEVVIGQTGTFTLQGDSVVYIGFGKDGQQERGRRICSACLSARSRASSRCARTLLA